MTAAKLKVVEDAEEGIERIPFAEYLKADGVSQSMLNLLKDSPFALDSREDREQTKDMILGSATHTALLEPEDFSKTYWRRTVDGRSVEGRAEAARHEGKDVLAAAAWKQCVAMKNAVWSRDHAISEQVRKLIRAGRDCNGIENSLFIQDDNEGKFWRKGRVDIRIPGSRIMADIKTTRNGTKRAFRQEIIDRGYHIQAAWYIWLSEDLGFPVEHFFFIFLQKAFPFHVFVYRLDDKSLAAGRQEALALYTRYIECVRTDHWPPAQERAEEIGLPGWYFRQEGSES